MSQPHNVAAWDASSAPAPAADAAVPKPVHPFFVRLSHWLTVIATIALVISGVELIISHPRFYWGEVGNVNTPTVFTLPIPASRATVPTGYAYTLPDQNGWSRSLHFQSAWLMLFVGAAYLLMSLRSGHLVRRLVPAPSDRSWSALRTSIVAHASPDPQEPGRYNVLQRTAYLSVIFILLPMVVWTGLAMAPGFTAVFPASVTILGGHQSARTLHFVSMIGMVAFTIVHVAMVARAGFRRQMRAMLTDIPEGEA
jgi:thiosulfate reductase cytochrome b subunit